MKWLSLGAYIYIWGTLAAAAPYAQKLQTPRSLATPTAFDFNALRKLKPENEPNQYYNWFDNIFEDHWGDHDGSDFNYSEFLQETLRIGWDTNSIYRQGEYCREEVTTIDPDPDLAKNPLQDITATPIFCHRGILVLLQYDPALTVPESPRETRNVPCKSYVYRAYELAAAINNKWHTEDNGFDPMFKNRKALPEKPGSFNNKVYTESVRFQWQIYDAIDIQIVGRTRWSEDRSEWIILALLNQQEQCPYSVDAFVVPA